MKIAKSRYADKQAILLKSIGIKRNIRVDEPNVSGRRAMMYFDYEEGSVILSALWDYDEYFLPRFVSREFLYKLIKGFMDKMQIHCVENRVPRPDLYDGKFDVGRNFEIDLSDDELDVIKRAVDASGFKGCDPAYPLNIQKAVDRLLLRVEESLGRKDYEATPENRDAFFKIFSGCILEQ